MTKINKYSKITSIKYTLKTIKLITVKSDHGYNYFRKNSQHEQPFSILYQGGFNNY